jgi:hypothetical protein
MRTWPVWFGTRVTRRWTGLLGAWRLGQAAAACQRPGVPQKALWA